MSFILPNQLSCFQCNSILIKEFDLSKINAVKGIIPFHIYNGEVNENKNKQFYTINSIQDAIMSYNALNIYNFYFYFNNNLLQPTDFDDIFTSNLLELSQNQQGCNIYLIVSNINFINFIELNYPNIKYFFQVNTKEDLEKIHLIHNNNNFQGIELNLSCCNKENIKNFSFKIIGKIPLFSCATCHMLPQCQLKEQMSILDFSESSTFETCAIKDILSLDTLTNYYYSYKDFISAFSFSEIPFGSDEEVYILLEHFFHLIQDEVLINDKF